MHPPVSSSDVFRVLVVCTANICRSPAGERLLRLHLGSLAGDGGVVEVASAGVRGLVGEPIDPDAADAVRSLGGDTAGFAARLLSRELVDEADLVLTATRAHRAAVVQLAPPALRRTFTLRELARLAGDMSRRPEPTQPLRLAAAVRDAASIRGVHLPERPEDDDVADPYRRSKEVHAATAQAIDQATRQVASLLIAACAGGERSA